MHERKVSIVKHFKRNVYRRLQLSTERSNRHSFV